MSRPASSEPAVSSNEARAAVEAVWRMESARVVGALARYTGDFPLAEDLARFLAGYTAVMNIVSIAFLFFVAGPLLRRYGLRLGIAATLLLSGILVLVHLYRRLIAAIRRMREKGRAASGR